MALTYIVAGDNGNGNSGHCVFGLYPTPELAQARIDKLTEDGEGAGYMYYESVEVGDEGGDCFFYVEG